MRLLITEERVAAVAQGHEVASAEQRIFTGQRRITSDRGEPEEVWGIIDELPAQGRAHTISGDHHITIHVASAGENDSIAVSDRFIAEGLIPVLDSRRAQRSSDHRLQMITLYAVSLARSVVPEGRTSSLEPSRSVITKFVTC